MLLVLLAGDAPLSLGASASGRLADLGITSVSLLRGEDAVGLVLEGWAFDPVRSADAARQILAGEGIAARLLRPVMHLAVRP